MGTWTAVPDDARGTVTGTWTLFGAQGQVVAGGGWSAAKSPKGWTGAWRAAGARGGAEYAGTWSADVTLDPSARFGDLFAAALQTVSGQWRAGGQSGAWSIRAFP
jgi:hypothetical protein